MIVFKILKFFMYIPFCLMFPAKFIGKKNLPKGGAVLVSNHTSNIDALLFAAHIKEENYYLAKKELFDKKLLGPVLKRIGGICIDRSINDVNAIKNCLRVLKNGRKLVIFPEGTRVHSDNMELGEIKGGAAMLAVKTRVPVVPIYINKTPRLFRKTIVTIGETFELSQFYEGRFDSEKQEVAGQILADKMHELRAQVIAYEQSKTREAKRKLKQERKEQKKALKG